MTEKSETQVPSGKGQASSRVLLALAEEFPTMHSRKSFIKCDSLRRQYKKKPNEPLTQNEVLAVTKTLGRLVGDKAVTEVLLVRGKDDRVNLPGSGLIAISVDITSLREEEWFREARNDPDTHGVALTLRGPALPEGMAPTQESIVQVIIDRSREWIKDQRVDGQLPLVLTNISIVHGSSAFDILINVSVGSQEQMLRYTRDVLQRIPHVRGTHTMLVSEGYGFSNISDATVTRAEEGEADES